MGTSQQRLRITILLGLTAVFTLIFSTPPYKKFMAAKPVAAQHVGAGEGLFQAAETAVFRQEAIFPAKGVVRGRLVEINTDLLTDNPQSLLTLNLFDNRILTSTILRKQQNLSGSTSWLGHIHNQPESLVILTLQDKVLVGYIVAGGERYEIRVVGHNQQAIVEVANGHYSSDPVDVNQDPPPRPSAKRTAPSSHSDDGHIIDVIVAYTDDARLAAGGTSAMESTIESAVLATNHSYMRSNITQRVNLVHMAELDFVENDGNYGPALDAFVDPDDGLIDEVHSWRNEYHADLMMLMVKEGSGCGRAEMVLPDLLTSYEEYGFAVTRYDCAVGNLSFAHELGHLMGARHDWYVDDTDNVPFEYNHGYSHIGSSLSDSFRTIMAYGNHCDKEFDDPCTRLPYWSNPDVSHNGNPTGNSSGGTDCREGRTNNHPCKAHNTLALNNTAVTVANFRSSELVWTGAADTSWNNASNWVIQEGVPGATTAVNRRPRPIDNIRIPASPAGGNFPTINDGTRFAHNLLLEDGATLTVTGGALTIYGDWEEQGAAQTTMTSGTVLFAGSFDQSITLSSSSQLHHVQLGDGSSKTITLQSDLDINGNLTIDDGTRVIASSYTLNIAGNWSDRGGGFAAGSSHVIFDGTTTLNQQLDTAKSYLVGPEGFAGSFPPSGWSRVDNTGNGDWELNTTFGSSNRTNGSGQSAASRGTSSNNSDSFDNELRSPSFTVPATGAWLSYRNNFQDFGSNGDAWLDVSSDGGSTWENLTFWSWDRDPGHTATLETADLSSYSGQTILLRWRFAAAADDTYYWQIDDVEIYTYSFGGTATFYDLTIAGNLTLNSPVGLQNDLTVQANGHLALGGHSLSVEGNVDNHGTLQQTKTVTAGTTTDFLLLNNATQTTTSYYGIQITPDSGQSLGATTIQIKGNQACTDNSSDPVLRRCFDITPTHAESATIKFWYSDAELNGQAWNGLSLWDWHSNSWQVLATGTVTYGAGCANDSDCWAQWTGVDTYSPMLLGADSQPFGAPSGLCAAPTPPTSVAINGSAWELTWSGETAVSHDIWHSTIPYFSPASACTNSGSLACTAGTFSPHSITPDATAYFWFVSVSSCGGKIIAPWHKGTFVFPIVPGS